MKKNTFLVGFTMLFGSLAFGAETPNPAAGAKSPPAYSVEQRQKMAEHHEKMAMCLKSDRPFPECRDEMMKSCKETMGKEGCPMMSGKSGHKMRHSM